ncbi:phosphoglycerate kinase [Methanosarcina barkeri]|uniref:Phosphoglycerate kinase n=1 Tax=Methanosarcina barkeri 227 TaxID=1434106 RepID=A0A0E3QYK4_METBA|nr:phosphoglycerate kinase [Methanosarcina barkeri]AKB57003.1 Phosphoglycerate kinase [Methanosarcina barkeri 227]
MSQETTGMNYLTMSDVVLDDKRVLVRVDFNSPMDDNGNILDDKKIKSHLPTLQSLEHSKVVLLSHQGRPGDEDYTPLEAHAKLATELLGREVTYEDDIFSSCARNAIKSLDQGEVLLLENTRFNAEEIMNRPPEKQAKSQMVKKLYPLFDLFINDAFSVSHRSQCSVVGFTEVLPSVAGMLMDKEITGLDKALKCHEHPAIFVLGGAKANDSIKAISTILKRDGADKILTTGVVATIFMMAMNIDVSEVNRKFIENKKYIDQISIASRLLKEYSGKIIVPQDVALNNGGERQEVEVDKIKKGNLPIADIGRETIENYSKYLKEAKLCVFHGPTGIFELDKFRLGTDELLKAATQASYSVAGGGHTLDAIDQLGLGSKFSHISMGGGASITYLSGEPLPGITALKNNTFRYHKG